MGETTLPACEEADAFLAHEAVHASRGEIPPRLGARIAVWAGRPEEGAREGERKMT
jgi:hypothetical protein